VTDIALAVVAAANLAAVGWLLTRADEEDA
jgi:hypothetical protein